MIQTCRHFKDHFREARERSSKALGFAKMLRKVNFVLASSYTSCVSFCFVLLNLTCVCFNCHFHEVGQCLQ